MPKHIIYSTNFEPITCIDVSSVFHEVMKNHLFVRLPVAPNFFDSPYLSEPITPTMEQNIIELKVITTIDKHFVLVCRSAEDNEKAVRLNAVFLVGQDKIRQEEFDKGANAGIEKLMNLHVRLALSLNSIHEAISETKDVIKH